MSAQRAAGGPCIEDFGNGALQRFAGFRQPYRVKVAVDQVLVGQIDSRWPNDALDHIFAALEEVLVMGALRRAVGEDQRRRSASAGTTATLRVVGGCWGHIAQIDGVKLGNV